MIFIVSVRLATTCHGVINYTNIICTLQDSKDVKNLEHHMHRAGYHFRRTIVDEARKTLERNGVNLLAAAPLPGGPESIPQSQHEINMQADAVLRDLFPRIPNTDRQEIILHAFQKVCGTPFRIQIFVSLNSIFVCEIEQQVQRRVQSWHGLGAATGSSRSACCPSSH